MAQARLDQEMLMMVMIGYEILQHIFREIPSDLDMHREKKPNRWARERTCFEHDRTQRSAGRSP